MNSCILMFYSQISPYMFIPAFCKIWPAKSENFQLNGATVDFAGHYLCWYACRCGFSVGLIGCSVCQLRATCLRMSCEIFTPAYLINPSTAMVYCVYSSKSKCTFVCYTLNF